MLAIAFALGPAAFLNSESAFAWREPSPRDLTNMFLETSPTDVTNVLVIVGTGEQFKSCRIGGFDRRRAFNRYFAFRRARGASTKELRFASEFWRYWAAHRDRKSRTEPAMACDDGMRARALENRAKLAADDYVD